jgi:arabinofuranosyltransferase
VNHGICDERGFYYPTCGLLLCRQYPSMPTHKWTRKGETFRRLVETGKSVGYFLSPTVGMQGAWAGPKVYILDPLGLADPLLAMAPIPTDRPWRIGHMERRVPLDYVRSVVSGENHMQDPGMARLFDALRRVHRGPILSPRRWVDIWKLNTGQYDDLIDREYFLYSRGESANPNLGKKF